jgi:hypothetical protein
MRTSKTLLLCVISIGFFLGINRTAFSQDYAEQKRKADIAAYEAKLKAMPRPASHPYTAATTRNNSPVQQIKNHIDLPGIPVVPGDTQYVSGQRQDTGNETIYSASYNIAMPVAEAVDWYNNGLTMYNWTVVHKSPSGVAGKNKNGDYATVQVNRTVGLPKYKSNVSIYVRQKNNSH